MKSDIRKTNKCFDHAFCSWDCKPRITGLVHDPVEESEAYLSIEKELEEKLRSYFSDKKIDSGSWFRTPVSCFEYWQVMRRFLWEDYRIEWRSPVELNPTIFKDGFIWRGSGRHQRRRLRVDAEGGGGDTSPVFSCGAWR